MKSSKYLVAVSVGLLLVGSVGVGVAKAGHSSAGPETFVPPLTGGASTLCKMGFQTQQNFFTPATGPLLTNPDAAIVTMIKPCAGPVIGTFVTETYTPGLTDKISLGMQAVCLGSGGQLNPCTTGQKIVASPDSNVTYLQHNSQFQAETNSMTMVWPALKKGKWRVEVKLEGAGTARVDFRTFTVQAFAP